METHYETAQKEETLLDLAESIARLQRFMRHMHKEGHISWREYHENIALIATLANGHSLLSRPVSLR